LLPVGERALCATGEDSAGLTLGNRLRLRLRLGHRLRLGLRCQASGVRLRLGLRCQASGVRRQASGVRFLNPEILILKSDSCS